MKPHKIKAPNGDRLTVAAYLAFVRLNGRPCHYGHIGCAGWKNGPCSEEVKPKQLSLRHPGRAQDKKERAA
jgi:hypothetical protein